MNALTRFPLSPPSTATDPAGPRDGLQQHMSGGRAPEAAQRSEQPDGDGGLLQPDRSRVGGQVKQRGRVPHPAQGGHGRHLR